MQLRHCLTHFYLKNVGGSLRNCAIGPAATGYYVRVLNILSCYNPLHYTLVTLITINDNYNIIRKA